VTGQASTILVYTILGFQTIIAIGFHHICWWSSYQEWRGLMTDYGLVGVE